jgi:hypothetical protein
MFNISIELVVNTAYYWFDSIGWSIEFCLQCSGIYDDFAVVTA